MERKEELENLFEGMDESKKSLINPMIDEIVFLEKRLVELKKLPLISVNPKNEHQQKITAAGKQYKEYMQSYTNVVKVLSAFLVSDAKNEYDPVAEFMQKMKQNET